MVMHVCLMQLFSYDMASFKIVTEVSRNHEPPMLVDARSPIIVQIMINNLFNPPPTGVGFIFGRQAKFRT